MCMAFMLISEENRFILYDIEVVVIAKDKRERWAVRSICSSSHLRYIDDKNI